MKNPKYRKESVENKRVIIFGFTKSEEIILKPLIREMTELNEFECIRSYSVLSECQRGRFVDIIVVSAMFIGFEVKRNMGRITQWFPESLIVCVSPYELSAYICWKFVKNGVEIMLTNMDSETEYQRAKVAIQKRRSYYPEVLRLAIERNEMVEAHGLNIISEKEREALAMTVAGYPVKDIAARMKIREATVSKMRTNAYTKTGLRSLPELINLAMRFNLHYREKKDDVV